MLLHDCDYSELASILQNPDINVNEFDEKYEHFELMNHPNTDITLLNKQLSPIQIILLENSISCAVKMVMVIMNKND